MEQLKVGKAGREREGTARDVAHGAGRWVALSQQGAPLCVEQDDAVVLCGSACQLATRLRVLL